jgi:hypothetical protein
MSRCPRRREEIPAYFVFLVPVFKGSNKSNYEI